MGKTYKQDIADDDFGDDYDMDFLDIEADDEFEFELDKGSSKKTGKKSDKKRAGRTLSAHRYLPYDWQDFDYGSTADGSWK